MLLWIFLIVFIVFLYYHFVKPQNYWKEKGILYIEPWPVFGNLTSVIFRQKTIQKLIEELYNGTNARYFGVYQFVQPTLFVKDVDILKDITIKEFDSFVDHEALVNEEVDPLFGHSLFSLKGNF